MVVVSVGDGNEAHVGVFLNVHDVGFVVLVKTVFSLVVLVVPWNQGRGDVANYVAGAADVVGDHRRTQVEHFADVGRGDARERKRFDLVNHFAGSAAVGCIVDMAVDLLTDELIETVRGFHGSARLVGVGVLAHPVDAAHLALVVELFRRFGQEVFDKRPFEGVGAFAVERANPGLFELGEVLELVGEHNREHAERFGTKVVVTFSNVVEVAADSVVSLRELAQPDIYQGCEILVATF